MPRSPNARPEMGPAGRATGAPGSHERPELVTLTPQECWRRIAGQSIGRLGVVRGGYPLIFPVNYAVHDHRIVFRTDTGAKFSGARQHRVSFEVDEVDVAARTGWSVLVQGFAVEVVPGRDDQYPVLAASATEPWPGARTRIVVITPISVTGRRIDRDTA